MDRDKLERIAEWSVGLEISGTAVNTARDARDIHIADSLAGLEIPAVAEAKNLVDIGAGAGFPGLVLAVALPETHVTLVDGVRKKMEAAAKFARELEIENLDCVWGRAEEIAVPGSPHHGAYDVVTARALAPLGALLEYAGPLLKVGGSLVAWKGSPEPEERETAKKAASELGFSDGELISTKPFAKSRSRHFFVAQKLSETPARYPRRAGMAIKRPLG